MIIIPEKTNLIENFLKSEEIQELLKKFSKENWYDSSSVYSKICSSIEKDIKIQSDTHFNERNTEILNNFYIDVRIISDKDFNPVYLKESVESLNKLRNLFKEYFIIEIRFSEKESKKNVVTFFAQEDNESSSNIYKANLFTNDENEKIIELLTMLLIPND